MRGYPKHIATKKDYENLLSMPEHKDRALKDIKAIEKLADDTVTRTISMDPDGKNAVTETIPNPLPKWKALGFASKKELSDKVIEAEVIS